MFNFWHEQYFRADWTDCSFTQHNKSCLTWESFLDFSWFSINFILFIILFEMFSLDLEFLQVLLLQAQLTSWDPKFSVAGSNERHLCRWNVFWLCKLLWCTLLLQEELVWIPTVQIKKMYHVIPSYFKEVKKISDTSR